MMTGIIREVGMAVDEDLARARAICGIYRRSPMLAALLEPREAMVTRIANLAGVDPEGGILPPDTTGGIDRTPVPWWKS
jgi:hypothetical protein